MTPDRFARYPSLRGKVVLITGGGSGIGASMVEQFAHQGAKVAFLDIAETISQELVKSLTEGVEQLPFFLPCDLTDISALGSCIQNAEESVGPIEVLVNNAANDERHEWEETTPEYWDRMMAVNLRHHFFAIQAVAPGMKIRSQGSIINMSSIAWMLPGTRLPAYISAKAGIVGLTRTMARELGPSGIRVNCVLPGAIQTEKQRRLVWTPEYIERILAGQSIKRTLMPEDVARLVLFLAADDSSAITNQSYVIDGGWV
ncbi:SDR family oxidoreductase [Alloacidobacterium dinghuense]|uniref:SDR family oxidoreductase n=1 Tax=Alloacidobacterium dinghuense TaxID=2763107 RepID=A0A7G8BI04_9BACT|nr:SDR family oxidoreductase [Alloacidobacterium dinghuense]QNI32174.1 SDR family oxidoreductase [Alloacidobacterium dinghuense]